MTNLTNMRKTPLAHQLAHVLMPILEQAMNYLEDLLCNQLNMWAVFQSMKRS